MIDNVVCSFQETIPNIYKSFRSSDGNIGAFLIFRKVSWDLNPSGIEEYEDVGLFKGSYFSVIILDNLAEKIGRDRYQGLRVERTDCEDVCVSGYTKCNRDEHVEQAVLSIE
ncbi:MAG: hypothetical protein J6M92_02360 [Oribacterium sp.]|nr:hypothetical protein [Oribacterium sp.]